MDIKAPSLHSEAWKEWADLCDALVTICEEELPDRAAEFAESVGEKLGSMAEGIRSRQNVTEKQRDAIINMEAGIARWLR